MKGSQERKRPLVPRFETLTGGIRQFCRSSLFRRGGGVLSRKRGESQSADLEKGWRGRLRPGPPSTYLT